MHRKEALKFAYGFGTVGTGYQYGTGSRYATLVYSQSHSFRGYWIWVLTVRLGLVAQLCFSYLQIFYHLCKFCTSLLMHFKTL